QAEDGIRDKLVTGVQTCALPILAAEGEVEPLALPCLRLVGGDELGTPGIDELLDTRGGVAHLLAGRGAVGGVERLDALLDVGDRSEERRVGKEGRSRWGRERWRI